MTFPSKTAEFAEALANGLPIKDAAAQVGWTYQQGNAALQRMRQKFGAQAA